MKLSSIEQTIYDFNENIPMGSEVSYYPSADFRGVLINRDVKHTITGGKAGLDMAGQPIVYLRGIGNVHISHVAIRGAISDRDVLCPYFKHLW